jgi:hypothetical protein
VRAHSAPEPVALRGGSFLMGTDDPEGHPIVARMIRMIGNARRPVFSFPSASLTHPRWS